MDTAGRGHYMSASKHGIGFCYESMGKALNSGPNEEVHLRLVLIANETMMSERIAKIVANFARAILQQAKINT